MVCENYVSKATRLTFRFESWTVPIRMKRVKSITEGRIVTFDLTSVPGD